MQKHAPLEGIRVIDFTSMMSGPFGTRLLADCGADLIKVEPLTGDYMRYRSPIRDGRSSYFGQMNCGKKSIALDLKSPEGSDIARRLIGVADVLVENFRPGVMTELGLGYTDLHDKHPELIYCSISGFGQTGSRASDPAYAPIIHAASGLDMTHLRWNSHLDRPPNTGIFTADAVSGVYAFAAIQSALVHRMRWGGGQHIDVSLLTSALNLLVYEFQGAQFGISKTRPLYEPLRSSDGGFVMVAPVSQNNFERLAEVVGHPEWKADERFATPRAREANWKPLMTEVEKWTCQHTARDCERILMQAGVPSSRFKDVDELVNDPEMRADGSFSTTADGSGPFLVPNPPFRMSESKVGAPGWVSDLGADSENLLKSLLGMQDAEILALRQQGVIAA